MSKGFITLATGKDQYYILARNLLLSYKLYCDEPLPFAILCDRENEYTALFDDVILLPNARNSYFDKFELLVHAPYEETIFIDSDCLAYADLNHYWDYFKDADDFSASGVNAPIDSDGGLFWEDSIGEYKGRVHWKPSIHGGLYFIRKGPVCEGVYRDYQNIMQHYDEYRWPNDCVDEPVFALAMAANGCRAIEDDPANYAIPWWTTRLECDLFTGKCLYTTMDGIHVPKGRLVHWSVRYCKKPLYRFEAEKLLLMTRLQLRPGQKLTGLSLSERIRYQWKLRYYQLHLEAFFLRVKNKLHRE